MKKLIITAVVFFLTAAVFGSYSLIAQDNDDCLGCHEDADMKMDVFGKKVSISISPSRYGRSSHKGVKCVKCHVNYDPYDIPHNPKKTPINCMSCHKDAASKHRFHPQMVRASGVGGANDVNCRGCHSYHYVESPKNPNSKFHNTNLTSACGECHEKQKAEFFGSEHHHVAEKGGHNTPNCIFCHVRPVTPGFKLDEAKMKSNQVDLCLECHLDEGMAKTKFAKTLINFRQSVHGAALLRGQAEAPSCIDCHGVHILQRESEPGSAIHKFNVHNICAKCHISVAMEYSHSVHGVALSKKNEDAPSCTFCHGEHNIRETSHIPQRVFDQNHIKRTVVEKNQMIYCIACHGDEELSKKYNLSTIEKAHDWLTHQVKHWETARCIDCHSSYLPPNLSHDILPPDKTIKKCEDCHSKNSILMSKLFQHEKQASREKFGFINGTILSDAYIIGTTRNIFLDSISIILFGIIGGGILLHAFLRWYFKKG